jgi:hypothetical protein
MGVSLNTTVPSEYARELDCWIACNLGEEASRADGVRALLSAALGLPPLKQTYHCRPSRLEQDERAGRLLEKRHDLGSWLAVAADEGLAESRVRELVTRYENRMKRDGLRSKVTASGVG